MSDEFEQMIAELLADIWVGLEKELEFGWYYWRTRVAVTA